MTASAMEMKEAAHWGVLDGEGRVWVRWRHGCASGTPPSGCYTLEDRCSTVYSSYSSPSNGCSLPDSSCSPPDGGCSSLGSNDSSTGRYIEGSSNIAEGITVGRHWAGGSAV